MPSPSQMPASVSSIGTMLPARRRLCALALAPMLLAGCASLPSLGDRPAMMSADGVAVSHTLGGGTAAWPDERWWQRYGDAQLDALIEEGLAGSPDIAAADARLAKARAFAQQIGADTLPTVAAEAAVTATKQSYNDGIPTQFVPRGYNDRGRASLSLAYDLDLAGANAKRRRAALNEAQAAAIDAKAARITIATAIAASYAELARLSAGRSAAEEALRIRQASLTLVERRVAEGLDTQGAAAQAAAAVPAARADLIAIDESIALVRNQLAALVGKGPDRGMTIVLPRSDMLAPQALPDLVPLDLVGRRPDIVAARLRAEAAAERIGAARADFYPSVNLVAFIGVQSLGLSNLVTAGSDIGSVGPAVTLPLFSGGRLGGAYRGARADYDLAVADYDKTLIEAVRAVADAAAVQRTEAAQLSEARAALDQSERAHAIARKRYQGGLADYLSVLTSEDSLLAARRRVADLSARRFAADVALVRALGGGFVSNP